MAYNRMAFGATIQAIFGSNLSTFCERIDLVNITFSIFCLLSIGGLVFAYMDKGVGVVTACFGAAILCLIFVNLPLFKRFKGLGIEAELLEKKLAEADELLHRLRGMTIPISKILFMMMARSGRWDTYIPLRQQIQIIQNIESELKQLGVTDKDLDAAKADWHNYNIVDMGRYILKDVYEELNRILQSKEQRLSSFKEPIKADDPEWPIAIEERNAVAREKDKVLAIINATESDGLKSRIKECISSSTILDKSMKEELIRRNAEMLKDMEYYVDNREFRRPEYWCSYKDDKKW